MSDRPHHAASPGTGVFLLELMPDPARPQRLAGRLVHASSGRGHDFGHAQALLDWIGHERRRDALVTAYRRAQATPP